MPELFTVGTLAAWNWKHPLLVVLLVLIACASTNKSALYKIRENEEHLST